MDLTNFLELLASAIVFAVVGKILRDQDDDDDDKKK